MTPAPRALSGQPLNAQDIALRCVDQSIRGMGYPGFETQLHIRLGARADIDVLRLAIERLGRRRPVITARLIEPPGGRPYWRFRHEAVPQLSVVELASNEASGVLDAASALLSARCDPAEHDPLRFSLLRRPAGGDIFVMQYSHVLMDNGATAMLVRELNQLATGRGEDSPQYEPRNVVGRYLRRVPRAQRRAATQAAIELQGHTLRGRAALLSTGAEDQPRRARLHFAARTLDAEATGALRAGIVRRCGLPNLSMAILASALRAIRELGPPQFNGDRKYTAGIGLDLNLRGDTGALLQNLLSLVPLSVQPSDLADRDELTRLLSRQMRSRLQSRVDLGALRLAHCFQRRPRHVRWVAEHLLRWTYSLWYAYFGSLDALGARFCGVEVEDVAYFGPTWSPLGIALLANQYRGRLLLNFTYDPDLVAQSLADSFLDQVLADLRSSAAGT
jgi:hypothetical protein